MMKVLIAGGGTGGHINPAIAIANKFKEKQPNAEILFAGTRRGMESRLVPQAGYQLAYIDVRGFQRSFSWHNLWNNILAVKCLLTSQFAARKIIRNFNPDIVIGTGGYVSGPILYQAAKMGKKTVIHEQNAFAGVTTKILSQEIDLALLAVEQAAQYLDDGCRYEIVGNPVRSDIIFAQRAAAREKLGIAPDRICILSFGGSLGAQKVNEAVADLMACHIPSENFHHIHATGQYGAASFPKLLKDRGVDPSGLSYIDIREYINDMADCMAAADLVIGRAGALTLSELQVAGKASILIPSPNVAENHQYHNAMVLQKADAAVVIEEKDLSGTVLRDAVSRLCAEPETLRRLGANAARMAIVDSADRIYDAAMKLL